MKSLLTFLAILISFSLISKDNVEKELRALNVYAKSLRHIKNSYYKNVDIEKFIYNSLKKAISDLDPHSEYFTQKEYDYFINNLDDNSYGIGLEYEIREGEIIVTRVYKNSPSFKVGIPIGAIIEKINDKKTFGKDKKFVNSLLKGKLGNELTLNYYYNDRFYEVKLIRDKIKKEFIEEIKINDNISYVKITQFNKNLTNILKKILIKNPKTSFIIDLRNNPGGYFDEAIDLSNLFLESGIIVSSKEKNNKEITINANKKTFFKNKINILVNEYTASAAEIFTAAMKENKRALIIGTRTFGKGSIQNIIKIFDGGALKLTTALYYTPKKNIIQGRGVIPHIILPKNFQLSETAKEKFLKNYIEIKEETKKDYIPEFLENDRQFLTAYNLFK